MDGAEPVRRIFRDDHKIAFSDSLRFSTFDARAGKVLGIGALFVREFARRS